MNNDVLLLIVVSCCHSQYRHSNFRHMSDVDTDTCRYGQVTQQGQHQQSVVMKTFLGFSMLRPPPTGHQQSIGGHRPAKRPISVYTWQLPRIWFVALHFLNWSGSLPEIPTFNYTRFHHAPPQRSCCAWSHKKSWLPIISPCSMS